MVGFVVSVALAVAGAGYWAFVGGMAAGTCAASLVAVWRSPLRSGCASSAGMLREYRAFSGPLLIAGAAGSAMAFGAALAAKLHLGVAAVGAIALAYNVVSFTDSRRSADHRHAVPGDLRRPRPHRHPVRVTGQVQPADADVGRARSGSG